SGLRIESVSVDGRDAKFTTPPNQLVVALDGPAKRGDKHQVLIKYDGQPKKGLYFILPDKNYPARPAEIWTQGESEDTHFYIPIYDYPNNRTASEMLLTVPASWITVSNGRLVGVKTEPDGMKTWHWRQSETLSTYLITAVAGEFVEKDGTWRGCDIRANEADAGRFFGQTRCEVPLGAVRAGGRGGFLGRNGKHERDHPDDAEPGESHTFFGKTVSLRFHPFP